MPLALHPGVARTTLHAALLSLPFTPLMGCARTPAAVRSEPPVYCYMHDQSAMADLELWPTAASGLELAEVVSRD